MRQQIFLDALCLLIAAAALAAGAWAILSGQVTGQGIDGLFLLVVCLLVAAAFAAIPAQSIRRGEWRELLKRKPKEKAAAAVAPSRERSDATS